MLCLKVETSLEKDSQLKNQPTKKSQRYLPSLAYHSSL
uniref:Uncharacterized protein n=1 Tax=Rhizophora mucronata TaxID=61149 RepID=A0A2P2PZH0_RHIMU